MSYETIHHKGLTITIDQDEDPSNPRKENDNVGIMICWHRRYDLGDETRKDDPLEWRESLAEAVRPGIIDWLDNAHFTRMCPSAYGTDIKQYELERKRFNEDRAKRINAVLDAHYLMLPVALIDHSGISMYIGSGAHRCDPGGWDSGQVGWIYCTRAKAIEEWGKKKYTKAVAAQAEKYLRGEVEEYDQYLKGDVYCYRIEDGDGEQLDSCCGFFGLDCAIEAAKEAADGLVEVQFEEAMSSTADIPMGSRA